MTDQEYVNDEAGSRFPFVNLEKALGRAKQLYDAAGDHEVLISDAFDTWGYSRKSSGGHQTVAALKMYGLVRDSGAKEQRKLALTDKGLQYFRDEREEVLERLKRQFALRPKLIAVLWQKWGASPPADNIARSHLKIDRELSDQAARSLLGIYKENLEFADVTGSGKMPEKGDDGGRDKIEPPAKRELGRKPGMKQDIFTLDEGEVVFQWPSQMSRASYEDLKAWAELVLRKVERSVVTDPEGKDDNADQAFE